MTSRPREAAGRVLRVRPTPVWLVILATLTIAALVLAFGQTLRQAVRQGEIRRAATAANTTAYWHCHSSHSRALLDSCLAQLNLPTFASSDADATPQGQHVVVVDLGVPISGR